MRHPAALVAAVVVSATSVVLASPSGVVAGTGPSPAHAAASREPAPPGVGPRRPVDRPSDRSAVEGEVIPGRYIVVLRPGHRASLRSLTARTTSYGGTVTRRYSRALDGFAARMSARSARALAHDPAVAFVEPDRRVSVAGTQSSPPWGLDRIDQRGAGLNSRYTYDTTGAGVTAYVIDSGIRRTHTQYAGRVASGFTAIKDGRGTRDCNGHGTHVAGTIGGKRYGVAKGVTLRPVRVLGCKGGGSVSGIISGIEWVTAHHTGRKPAVANMSLGGPASRAMDNAVRRSVFDGVTFVVAAGNESIDACALSPAATGSAITVGATTARDARASFSDFGPCVDLFAPGTGIRSASHTSDTATATHSGTSMASPHVAGAAALYLQAHPTAAPAEVGDALLASATPDVVTNRGPGSPGLLLFSLADRVAPEPVLPPVGNVVLNPSLELGTSGWKATPDVVTDETYGGARTGSWAAWLNGWGEVRVDALSQTVTVPAGPQPLLSFWLLVATEEDASDAYDVLTVSVEAGGVRTPVVTRSNQDASGTYVPVAVDLAPWAGQSVTLRFEGVEDEAYATSFVIDDIYVTGQ